MRITKRKGFSLTEFLIIILITIIALAIAIMLYTSVNRDYKVLISYLNSFVKARETVDKISKDCRMAIRIMDNYGAYTTSDDCLILKVPSIDTSGDIVDVDEEFDYIVYRINNGDLWKTVIPGSNSARLSEDGVLKKSVESLLLASDGTPLSSILHKSALTRVTVWVAVSETVLGKKYTINPGTTIKLMNYEWRFIR